MGRIIALLFLCIGICVLFHVPAVQAGLISLDLSLRRAIVGTGLEPKSLRLARAALPANPTLRPDVIESEIALQIAVYGKSYRRLGSLTLIFGIFASVTLALVRFALPPVLRSAGWSYEQYRLLSWVVVGALCLAYAFGLLLITLTAARTLNASRRTDSSLQADLMLLARREGKLDEVLSGGAYPALERLIGL